MHVTPIRMSAVHFAAGEPDGICDGIPVVPGEPAGLRPEGGQPLAPRVLLFRQGRPSADSIKEDAIFYLRRISGFCDGPNNAS